MLTVNRNTSKKKQENRPPASPSPCFTLTVNRNTSKKKQENRPPASPLLQKVNVLGTEMKIIGANETVKEVLI
jgi:ribosomal 50S subunit-associated protein YjgA (DUF615 family)